MSRFAITGARVLADGKFLEGQALIVTKGEIDGLQPEDMPPPHCYERIRLDGGDIGHQAGEAVLAAIRGLHVPDSGAPAPAELVVRASTAPPRSP